MHQQNQQPKTVFLFGSYAPSLIKFRGALIAQMVAHGHKVIAAAPDIDQKMGITEGAVTTAPAGSTEPQVQVQVQMPVQKQAPTIVQQLEDLGAQAVNIPMSRTGTNPLADLKLLRELIGIISAHRPDVFIPYTIKPVIWGSLAARQAGVAMIAPMITGLGLAFDQPQGIKNKMVQRAIMMLYRRALTGAGRIFFQNHDDLAELRARRLLPVDLPVTMINGSGVDIDAFAQAPLPGGPNFLMIARLLKAKGVREYAEAAMAVKRRHPNARFTLVGWIDEGSDAITRADLDSWIAGGIDYAGALDDVRPALRDASIYVLPSYREGTPRSVLEAMAMGRPIITTDAPGCRETVEQGVNGLLVPPRDVAALTTAMLQLIEEPERRCAMGEQSRRLAEEKFDVNKVNGVILDALGL